MVPSLAARLALEIRSLSLLDGVTVGTLAILEALLSVDNALVLAILVRPLPKAVRKKALTYGIVGAFFFRFLALVLAVDLMRLMAFKLIGGAYLLYLAMKHMFFPNAEDAHQASRSVTRSFWKTVIVVEATDIAFAVDSITTSVAMSRKLLIVWAGGVLGIVFLRFLSALFVHLLERWPKLEDLAYQLILFVGTKLVLESFGVAIGDAIFWTKMGVIVVLGSALVYRDAHERRTRTRFEDRLLERLKAGEVDEEELLALDALPSRAVAYLREVAWLDLRLPGKGSPSEPPEARAGRRPRASSID